MFFHPRDFVNIPWSQKFYQSRMFGRVSHFSGNLKFAMWETDFPGTKKETADIAAASDY